MILFKAFIFVTVRSGRRTLKALRAFTEKLSVMTIGSKLVRTIKKSIIFHKSLRYEPLLRMKP